ncbi:dimeric alpha-beta barrel [Pyrenophora seminiperda CCB06]|uniref:Dimeric alpha-beta barrel n=1 Tax=Pyrenophora seminiperda CCB06 TaxID=1302712 RepID=A0A3M7MBC7_9PLEO|nr:dimeric alpha-beta barrel [Pyrenophora seminiperda CCB06]
MTYTIVLFITRNHVLSSDEFRDYYEHKHIPLALSLLAPHWPISFTRRYLARISRKGFGGPANPDRPPLMLRGTMNELDCDCIAEMSFKSEAHFQEFYKCAYAKENAALLARDEEKFLEADMTKIIVVGETWSTDEQGVSTSEIGYVQKDARSDSETSGSSYS